jgi:hypothetical protein
MKITAIHGGGDWADASADYLILPDGMDFDAEKQAREKWLEEVYWPLKRAGKHPEYISLVKWLVDRGAVEPTKDQLVIVNDD